MEMNRLHEGVGGKSDLHWKKSPMLFLGVILLILLFLNPNLSISNPVMYEGRWRAGTPKVTVCLVLFSYLFFKEI